MNTQRQYIYVWLKVNRHVVWTIANAAAEGEVTLSDYDASTSSTAFLSSIYYRLDCKINVNVKGEK